MSFQQISATGDFVRTGGTCSTSAYVAAGGTCSVSVKFSPTAPGSRTGALTFHDNASTSPQNISLTGTGTAPVASLSTTSLSFGTVRVGSTSSIKTVWLTNTGNAPRVINAGSITGDYTIRSASTCHGGSTLRWAPRARSRCPSRHAHWAREPGP